MNNPEKLAAYGRVHKTLLDLNQQDTCKQ